MIAIAQNKIIMIFLKMMLFWIDGQKRHYFRKHTLLLLSKQTTANIKITPLNKKNQEHGRWPSSSSPYVTYRPDASSCGGRTRRSSRAGPSRSQRAACRRRRRPGRVASRSRQARCRTARRSGGRRADS